MTLVVQSKLIMTPDIQAFLHAMHDGHQVEAEKQSLRNGTSGYIPFFDQPLIIKKLMKRLTDTLIQMIGNEDWGYTGLWCNRLPKGGYHVSHTHPKGWFSGIVYIDVPDTTTGWLEFEDQVVEPETGKVVLFPSTTPHAVSVYEGDKPRLAVAFDLLKLAPKNAK